MAISDKPSISKDKIIDAGNRSPSRIISILYRKGLVYKNTQLKDINITGSEQPFIMTIHLHEGVSQEFLSSFLNIDKASTARVIQSLINKGLVEKVRCKEDKRQNKIYLTERGQDLIYPIYSVLDSWVGILTADMTKEEKDMAYHYLERMAKNVERIFNGTSKKNNSSK